MKYKKILNKIIESIFSVLIAIGVIGSVFYIFKSNELSLQVEYWTKNKPLIIFILGMICLLFLMLVLKHKKNRQAALLLANYLFFLTIDYRYFVLVLLVSVYTWFIGLNINKNNKYNTLILSFSILFDFLILFFLHNFCNKLSALHLLGNTWILDNLVLPFGASFFIFQSVSYLFDIYNGVILAEKRMLNVLLAAAFFPQIFCGPLLRTRDFLLQLNEKHKLSKKNIFIGFQYCLFGLFKKCVIANRLSACTELVFNDFQSFSSVSLIIAAVAFSIELYLELDGFSDIAIGISRMFGYKLGKNFNLPYLAKNPVDFWERWYISLSKWIRDYIYEPVSKRFSFISAVMTFIFMSMLLEIICHSTSAVCICIAIINCVYLLLYKLLCKLDLKIENKYLKSITDFICSFLNFNIMSLIFIFVRLRSVDKILIMLNKIFSLSAGKMCDGIFYVALIGITLFVLQAYAYFYKNGDNPIKHMDLGKFRNKALFFMLILSVLLFAC